MKFHKKVTKPSKTLGKRMPFFCKRPGIKNKTHPGEAWDKNLHDLPAEELADIPTVCGSLREAMEESGINDIYALSDQIFDIDIHEIPARGKEAAHFHYDCRFLLQATHDDYVISEESYDLRWIGAHEITTLTDEASVLRMVRKWWVLKTTE